MIHFGRLVFRLGGLLGRLEASGSRLGLRLGPLLAPKMGPKTDPRAGPISGPTPFGDPNQPKIGPRWVLRRLFFENDDFSKKEPRVGHSTILSPETAQDEAKIDPRSAQDGLKTLLKRDRF